MDLLSKLKAVFEAVAPYISTIAGIVYLWEKRGSLISKIKSAALFLHLPEARKYFCGIYRRIFRSKVEVESKISLPDYVNSFGEWKSKSNAGIQLPVKGNAEIEVYKNVTSIGVSPLDPFSPSPLYGLDIEQKKLGYASYGKCILGISHDEIHRLAKQFYFREIVESQHNEIPANNYADNN